MMEDGFGRFRFVRVCQLGYVINEAGCGFSLGVKFCIKVGGSLDEV